MYRCIKNLLFNYLYVKIAVSFKDTLKQNQAKYESAINCKNKQEKLYMHLLLNFKVKKSSIISY